MKEVKFAFRDVSGQVNVASAGTINSWFLLLLLSTLLSSSGKPALLSTTFINSKVATTVATCVSGAPRIILSATFQPTRARFTLPSSCGSIRGGHNFKKEQPLWDADKYSKECVVYELSVILLLFHF